MGLRSWLKERKLRKPVLTAVIDWNLDEEQYSCDLYEIINKEKKRFIGKIWFSDFIEYGDRIGLYNGNANVDENNCGILWKYGISIQVLSVRP